MVKVYSQRRLVNLITLGPKYEHTSAVAVTFVDKELPFILGRTNDGDKR